MTLEQDRLASRSIYLASYRPLTMNARGKAAIEDFGLPPYVDHSCRREPDFESQFPSISAICRGSKFAPRINESDLVVYITVMGRYFGYRDTHWRLTAILEVISRFESHREAAEWYQTQGLEPPNNCMIRDNPPRRLAETSNPKNYLRVERWDALYRKRIRETPVFLVCRPLFLELDDPPVLTRRFMLQTFGRVPATRNPPRISVQEYQNLAAQAGV